MQLTESDKGQIFFLVGEGLSHRAVASNLFSTYISYILFLEKLNISHATMSRLMKKYTEINSVQHLDHSAHKKSFSYRELRIMKSL